MPIEFRCSQCDQLLRVPETAAGKHARCPRCQALMAVPSVATAVPAFPGQSPQAESPSAASPHAFGSPVPPASDASPIPSNPFSGEQAQAGFPPPPVGNPFGEGTPPPSLNPYASPAVADATLSQFAVPAVPIDPRPVSADTIFNYAWFIWKTNLGLLVGVSLTVGAANYVVGIPFQVLQAVLQQQGEDEAAIGAIAIGQIVANLIQMYLGIGVAHINLKLARRQPATFGDLFGGIGLLLPVLGGSIIAYLALILGALFFIVPAILMLLAYWPFYYLIVDRKAGVMESFSVASRITQGNWANSFLLWLMSMGIIILGCLALCVGLLFAAPLVGMMFTVAYLMMSGQLVPYGVQPAYPPQYPPPPANS